MTNTSLIWEFPDDYLLGMPLIREFPNDYRLGMPLIRKFSCDYFLGMLLIREFPHYNINLQQKIKHFIPQKIVVKSTALSNKQYLRMHLCYMHMLNVFRPLAWPSVL